MGGGGKRRTVNLFLYSFCLVFYPTRRVCVSLLVYGGEAKEAFPGGGCPVGPSCPQVVSPPVNRIRIRLPGLVCIGRLCLSVSRTYLWLRRP